MALCCSWRAFTPALVCASWQDIWPGLGCPDVQPTLGFLASWTAWKWNGTDWVDVANGIFNLVIQDSQTTAIR